jgi:preprotein translocase subunit SecY
MGNLLDRMEPLLAAMPAVKSPEGHVHFKNKLIWTLGILILYFALTNIPIFGMAAESQDLFAAWRALLAGASGSIVHLGIGPIVTASIVLQLLKGADILRIDTSETRGQVVYSLQKILVMVMIVVGCPEPSRRIPSADLIASNFWETLCCIIHHLHPDCMAVF